MSANQFNKNTVSIRLMSGGHSFSSAEISELAKEHNSIVAEIITPKITLVPEVMFDASRLAEYLAFVGLAPAHDEVAVCSPGVDDKVAVMAMSKECYSHLALTFGANVSFSSPLIKGHAPKQGALLELVGDVLYLRIFNGDMLFGEAIHVVNDADLLIMLESVNRVYNIYNMHVRAQGDIARLTKCCKHLFNDLECE